MADEYYTPDNEPVKNTQTDFQSTAQQAQNVPPQQTQQAQNIPPDQRQNHGAQPGGNIPPNANFYAQQPYGNVPPKNGYTMPPNYGNVPPNYGNVPPQYYPPYPPYYPPYPPVEQKANAGLAVLSWFIPLAGLVIYLTEKDTKPKTAKACGKCALASFIINVVLVVLIYVVFFIVLGVVIPNAYDSIQNLPTAASAADQIAAAVSSIFR